MATRELLSETQRTAFERFPEMDEREMVRHWTLSEADLAAASLRRTPANRLGFSVQLCLLRYPGRPLQAGEVVPYPGVEFIASQIGADPGAFGDYAGGTEGRGRDTTRREHLREIVDTFGFRAFDASAYRELSRWLLPVAMSADSGEALVEALLEEMRARNIISPALYAVERLGWEARNKARRAVFARLTGDLSRAQLRNLDELLFVAEGKDETPLNWLRRPPGPPSAKNFKEILERLEFLRSLELPADAGGSVHHNRLTRLAREGAKTTPQHLRRFDGPRRHATLVAYLTERSAELSDVALQMHDRMIGALMNKAERMRDEGFRKHGKAINEKVGLYAKLGEALIAARQSGGDPYDALDEILPWEKFVASVAEAGELAMPQNFDYLDFLEAGHHYVRRYAPALLEAFEFKAAPSARPLLDAVEVLKEMNKKGKRKVPENAPVSFVKPRWRDHVLGGNGEIDKRYYELSALSELKNSLRSGDVWVSGSRRYRDFDDYLLPPEKWESMKDSDTSLPVSGSPDGYLEERSARLHDGLLEVGRLIRRGVLEGVSLEKGNLKISPIKKDEPEGMEAFTRHAYSLLPRVRLTDLLVEVDAWTGFTRHFTHLKSGEPVKDKKVLHAALLADGVNLGLAKMAEATDDAKVTYERLAWASDWHVRDETYQRATSELVNHHHCLPFSGNWGKGTTSSSDGQRFQAGGHKDFTAQVNARYGREPGMMFYTHISDQYSPFYTRVINTSVRDATHVLDGLLYHETDLDIDEHYVDTEGYTDQVFAMCHLLGFRFAPRIRGFKDRKLYTMEKPSHYKDLAPLIGGRVRTKQIATHWDDILRLSASVKAGTVTASLILSKLASYPRRNGLAWALKEIGKIERTLFALEWMKSPLLRRRVTAGLNKGEARNALARAVFFNRLGEMRDRSYEDQMHRASGLNLICSAISLWNTTYIDKAVRELRTQGAHITDEHLRHLSPLGWEHISLTGVYRWSLDTPPPGGLRQLRA
ncbi:Tn3-like element TnAs1 family transposase [soil metagenome]